MTRRLTTFALLALLTACGDSTGPSGSSEGFTIAVRYVDRTPPAAAVVGAFNQAAARWERIIVDSVGSLPVQLAAGQIARIDLNNLNAIEPASGPPR